MKSVKRPCCGAAMKRSGKTGAGSQRWRRRDCGASRTVRCDGEAARLREFAGWLLSKESRRDMPGRGRAFRRRAASFRPIRPMPEVVDEAHRAVFVDGVWVARDAVVLIACTESHVLSRRLARAETSAAWRSLLSRVAPPDMAVSDGGGGFARAVAAEWPRTRVQRRLFHVFCRVKRQTTTRPKLQAGVELYALAKELLRIETLRQAEWWAERFLRWRDFWSDFLARRGLVDGRLVYAHERLRKARRGIVSPVDAGTLFTHLDPALSAEGPLPATNNAIEGGANAQLRSVPRNRRGLSTPKRVKAVFRWRCMRVECPKGMPRALREMPTDSDIGLLRAECGIDAEDVGAPKKWGEGIVWEELHHKARHPCSTE